MKLLVVSYWCPSPPDNGSRLRAYHLIRQLSRQGHALRLLSLTQPESDLETAQADLGEMCVLGTEFFPSRVVFQPRAAKAIVGFLTPRPRHVLEMYHAEFAEAVARECGSGRYDAAVVLELGAAHYVPAKAALPCLLDQLEVSPFVKAVREANSARDRMRRSLTLAKLRAHLVDLAKRYALWTAVSAAEAESIRSLVGSGAPPVKVLPNGVDLSANAFEPDAAYDRHVVVYNGALTFSANADAVRWFAAEILPIIAQEDPAINLHVTGRNDTILTDDPLRRMLGVTLTGFLPDVRPAVRNALACVVPLRQGGGTRLKILEAMALGVPVITTSRGAEGLAVTAGQEILLAETPEAFAAAIRRLQANPSLRAQIGAAGRRLVEREYGWDALGEQLAQALQDLICERSVGCR